MVNQQTLQGNWNELKGKLREKWGQLTNEDLQVAQGNVDQLIGLIQRKTGEARSGMGVVVIGADIVDMLFSNEAPIGNTLFIRGHRFRVGGRP